MSGERNMGKLRLNRFLARAGVGSRREVEKHILEGRIKVNGKVCRELGTYVTPGVDVITFGDSPVRLPSLFYYAYYKPRGVVCTMKDPHARNTLGNILRAKHIPAGVVPAGRLDKDSEGLLILTNDGDLLYRLTHPSREVKKVYRVLVNKRPAQADFDRLKKGVRCREFTARAVQVFRLGPQPPDDENPHTGYWIEVTLIEGRKREVREMLKALGCRVLRLVRIAHGRVTLPHIKPGEIVRIENPQDQEDMDRVSTCQGEPSR